MIVLALAALLWAVSRFDAGLVLRTVRGARAPALLAAAAIYLGVHTPLRAFRWCLLLRPFARPPFREVLDAFVAGLATASVFPSVASDLVRVALMRRQGVATDTAVGIQLLEKGYEVFGLLLLVAPLPWVLRLQAEGRVALHALMVVAAIVAAAAIFLAARGRVASGRLSRIGAGLSSLQSPRLWSLALVASVGSRLLDVAGVWLVLCAVGIHIGSAQLVLLVLLIDASIAVPTTPAGLGAVEASAVLGLHLCGVATEPALGFALLYHAVQALPVTLWGLLVVLGRRRRMRLEPLPPAL